jgi:hypothetical protein
MKTIKFTISPLGKPRIEADGFADASCKNATKPYETMLSGGKEDQVVHCDKIEASIPASNDSLTVGLG